jgi:acyl dehydratase
MGQGAIQYYEDVELGDEIGPLQKDIRREAVADFCEVWDNPVPNRFTDEKAAKEVGLAGPIVPGAMSMALMAQLLTGWCSAPPGSPAGVLKHLDVVFRQPVPHRPVVIAALVTDKREEGGEYLVECDVYMSNEESGRLAGGKAIISLPSRQP